MSINKKIFSIQWHLTNKCDQICQHCYIYQNTDYLKDSGKELTFEKNKLIINDFLSFCDKMKCEPRLSITGGDPLLYKHIWETLSYIAQTGIKFSILGNPFHLDKSTCHELKKLGCISYQMSLDGLEKNHDKIRKNGSFHATLEKIPLLKQTGIKTAIMTTVSKLNYRDIPDLIRLITRLNVDVYAFARYCPTANDDAKDMFTPLEYKEFLQNIWNIYEELAEGNTTFSLKDHLWIPFLHEKGLISINHTKTIVDGCNCGFKHITLLPDGTVYACRRFTSPVGRVPREKIINIFLGNKMEKYRSINKLVGCSDCVLLNYCRGCHAVSFGTYGDYFAKDPQCWKS
jgi:radical SAM/SPASM domain protein of ACGX system